MFRLGTEVMLEIVFCIFPPSVTYPVCCDSYVNMVNAPIRHFSCPASPTTYRLAQGLER